ncbi:WD40 repeat domain-containing serine/threonine protein kinase [Polymorphospora rubra]|uniref:WD40 repeat domain-containing serine/threonine protein kinase n=1 Tax=Polymorphospora rubra TaxID=338584 RepID=UPI0033C38FDD
MEPLGNGDPKRLGPYRLRARLGAGAMGQVYLGEARDGRHAAVKLLRAEFASSPEYRERFAREFAAARSVTGPRTAPVFDADPRAARPWFASAYVPGPTLHEHVAARGPFDAATTAALGAGLVAGLQAIHAKGLVHRDLKPSNVIIAEHGPVIIDFGISRAIDASTLTATGTILGTYGYMAPEQITADTATFASDVFALGCALAFAANGKGPFDASTVAAVIHRVVAESPELGGLSGELRTLVESCLAKDPVRRPTPQELHRRLTAAAGPTPAPTLVDPAPGPGFARGRAAARTWIGNGPTEPFTGATASKPRRRWLSRRNLLIAAGVAAVGTAAPVGWNLWSNRYRLTGEDLDAIAINPDGTIVVAALWSGGGVRIWDAYTRDVLVERRGSADISALAFAPDGSTFATAGANTPVEFRDPTTGQVTRFFDSPLAMTNTLAFDVGGGRLVQGGHVPIGTPEADEICALWDVESGKMITRLPFATKASSSVHSALFLDGGTILLAGDHLTDSDSPGGFWLWHLDSSELEPVGPDSPGYGVAMSPDGRLALGSEAGCWLSLAGSGDKFSQISSAEVDSLAFTPDGSELAVADKDGIALWDVGTAQVARTITDQRSLQLTFNNAGTRLASGGWYVGGSGGWLWPID